MRLLRPAPLLVLLACALLAQASRAEPFVFVALPDTQVYAEDRFPGDGRSPVVTDERGTGAIFYDQTEWVRDNADDLGIRYVGHLGDIVQNGDDLGEWALARDAMDILIEEDKPAGTVMGNHDDNHGDDYSRNYLDHFGPQVFQGRPWYAGASPNGGANFQLLQHGYYKLGFLNFSIDHPQEEIDWAHGVVAAHPDTIFIIGTHRYLFDLKIAAGRYGENLGLFSLPANPIAAVPEPNSAQELFEEFVTQHPNILMIHAGHFHAEWLRLDGVNSAAQTILQILTDYQSTRNGGDGYLRIYRLDFEEGTFQFDTYSPTLDRERTTIDHFVEFIYLTWAQRQDVMDLLGLDEQAFIGLIEGLFGDRGLGDFLDLHPDFDTEEERAYYQQYLDELFSVEGDMCDDDGQPAGCVPQTFFDAGHWQGLWIQAFAADINDLADFGDGPRSPRGTVDVDFSAYFTPSPEQLLAMAFETLRDAIEAVPAGDFTRPRARRWLLGSTARVERFAERGRTRLARWILRLGVISRVDGCALRGRPDTFWLWPDLIGTCESQAPVYDAAQEVLARLEEAGGP